MKHYDTLDALRGVAASAVVIYHLNVSGMAKGAAPHGYLAVDFFFVLSGFVTALAFRDRLASNLGFFDFIKIRVIRIYPTALTGLALGFAVVMARYYKHGGTEISVRDIFGSCAFNIFLIPDFLTTVAMNFDLFPGNGALWSLFFGMVITLVWAGVLWRLSRHWSAALCLLSAILLIQQVVSKGNADIGWSMPTIWGGAARAGFSFVLGTLIVANGWRIPAPASPSFGIVLGLILLALLLAPVAHTIIPFYDLTCIFLAFPIIIMLGMNDSRSGFNRYLGQVSYPLYATHVPILYVFGLVGGGIMNHVPVMLFCIGVYGFCVAAACATLHLIDIPIRKKLSRLMYPSFGLRERSRLAN